jgi:hypothetical protein
VTELVVTEMELLTAVGDVVQLALLVITTETTSLLLSDELVKVTALAPGTLVPFICHWYVGIVPPFVGVALNVILLPAQIEVELAVTKTEGVTEFTVIVIELLTAVGDVVQLALLVITTETTSLSLSKEVVKVAELEPGTLIPFICHW